MNYPLDVEVCVRAFNELEGNKEKSIKFLRAVVSILNDIYEDGLVNLLPESPYLMFHEKELKKCFRVNYENFLVQAKDAYRQGQEDSVRNDTRVMPKCIIN
jgi:hypothetical protein